MAPSSKVVDHSPPRYRKSWHRQFQQVPRWGRLLFLAVVATCAFGGLYQGLRNLHDQHIKLYPTDFSPLHGAPLWSAQHPVRRLLGTAIDDRYVFLRALGHGQEGYTALYNDLENNQTVVVKTFTSTARNGIPAELAADFIKHTDTWPSEIEAGLLLGDTSLNSSFLTVVDYFILETGESWAWSLVSPYVAQGTLEKLATHEEESRFASPDQLDRLYHSTFADLLNGLAPLHEAGMCHDDVKTDNVFIHSPTRWLLGDLGNLRHQQHPWHRTGSWIRQNQWADCQLNDIRRALKTYLLFLRSASANTADFDRQFWEGKAIWSQYYWQFLQDVRSGRSVNARDVAKRVAADDTGMLTSGGPTASRLDPSLADKTKRELICTVIPRRLWKWWWWVGLS